MPPPSQSASVPARAQTGEEPVLLELAGVGLALTGLLLGSAIVTLAPEGSLRPLANVTGAFGRRVAESLTLALGLGAYVVAAFPVAWGIACLRGRAPAAFGRKAALAPLVALTTAVLAALLLRRLAIPGLFRSGPGGYLGVAFGQALFHGLGRAASLLTAGLFLASLLLTTDLRVSALLGRALPQSARRRRRAPSESDADGGGTAVLDDPAADDDADDDSEGGLVPVGELDAATDDDAASDSDDSASDDSASDRDDDDVPASADASPAADDSAAGAPPALLPRPRRPRAPRPQPKRRAGAYEFPPTALLEPGESVDPERVRGEVERNAAVLGATLRSFGIEARVVSQRRGPVITFYELELGSGTRINKITTLDKDLAVALKAESVRVVAPIPGKNTVGVEVPNTIREPVRLLDILEEGQERGARKAIPLFLGKDAMGEPIVEDLAGMPHMLIAGATGSGKSVCVNSILLSVLLTRTPDEVKFVLMDPKQVELSFFEGIPHLLTPVVTNMKKASQILEWAVAKMEQRYDLLLKCGVRNISGYNAQGAERIAAKRTEYGLDALDAPDLMPYLVIVVDELADLMLQHGKDVETAIIRLAAKSRAVGIHLILATQRPSVDVITGLIKSNMPMRMSFKVSSMIDSRVILDHKGAEKLLGRGDTLFIPPGTSNPKRAQGTYISDAEVKAVVDFVKEKAGPAEYLDLLGESETGLPDPMKEDELYDEAVTAVLTTKLGSASMLQRKFGIGYTRASRLIDMMCDHRVVGPHKGSKAREILVTLEEWGARRAEEMAGSAPGAADFSSPPDPDAGAPMGSSDTADGIGDKGASKDASGVPSAWD